MSNGRNIIIDVNGRQYQVSSRELRIGRGSTNQVNLSDSEASRNHAIIWASQGIAFINDMGSHNGTFVNEERISGQRTLNPGDRIRIGKTNLNVSVGVGGADTSSGMGLLVGLVILVVVALIGALAYITITNSNSAAPRSLSGVSGPVTSPALATVVLTNLDASAQIGSGFIANSRGYVLTSAVALTRARINVPEGCQNTAPEVMVGLIPEEARPPEKFYRAQVFCGDPGAGLVLLFIIATDGGGPLPPNLIFPSVALGNSDTAQLGGEIKIVGFPGVQRPIKSIPGNISEFLAGLKGTRSWLTTHTVIDPGMVGGVVTANGQVIAMPSERTISAPLTCQPTCLIPINSAQGLLSQAR